MMQRSFPVKTSLSTAEKTTLCSTLSTMTFIVKEKRQLTTRILDYHPNGRG